MYSSKIAVGDRYGDGHGQHETYNLVHACSPQEISEAYRIGSETIGFDFANNCCEEYEDSTINEDHLAMLREAGINLDKLDEYGGLYRLDSDSFVDIILQIIKLGATDTEIEIVPDSVIPTLNLNGYSSFGYGLFSQ